MRQAAARVRSGALGGERTLLLAGALLVVGAAAYAVRGGPVVDDMGGASMAALLGWLGVACGVGAGLRAGGRKPRASTIAVILVTAAVARVIVLAWHPGLSDDVYRFLWDGRVLLSGRNPYAHAPADPALSALRDPLWSAINHRDLRTIYPPLAEMFAAAVAWIAPGELPFRAAVILLDLALCAVLTGVLARSGRAAWSVLYAWNPLAIVETAGSGHVEPLATLPLVAALLLVGAATSPKAARRIAAGALLGLSVLAKYGALLVLPSAGRRLGRAGVLACAGVVAIGFLPFAGARADMFSSLGVYARHWEFNGAAFPLLSRLAGDRPARFVAYGLIALGACAAARIKSPARAAALVLTGALLLSPTVHPWYLLWPLPLAVLALGEPGRKVAWTTVVWSGTALVAYEVLRGYHALGVWRQAAWTRPVEYAPALVVLLAETGAAARLAARSRGTAKALAYVCLRPLVLRLPRRAVYALGGALGAAAYAVSPALRRRIRRNVASVHAANGPGGDVERIVRAAFRHRARYVIESWLVPYAATSKLDGWFDVTGEEAVEHLAREGRGAVIPLIHFGPFTLAGARLAVYGLPVVNVAQGLDAAGPDRAARLLSADRYRRFEEGGGGIVLRGTFLRGALEALRDGKALSLFFDAPAPGAMTTVDFLGLALRVHRGAAAVALRTGAPILLMGAWRTPEGRVRIEIDRVLDPPHTGDRDADIRATMQEIADYMAGWVRRFPDQWMAWKDLDQQVERGSDSA